MYASEVAGKEMSAAEGQERWLFSTKAPAFVLEVCLLWKRDFNRIKNLHEAENTPETNQPTNQLILDRPYMLKNKGVQFWGLNLQCQFLLPVHNSWEDCPF